MIGFGWEATATSVYDGLPPSSDPVSASGRVPHVEQPMQRAVRPQKSIESAVYAHIRALRALGQTRVNTAEIATALGISTADVNAAIASLRDRGVKFAA